MMDLVIPRSRAEIDFKSNEGPALYLWGDGISKDGDTLQHIEGDTIEVLIGNANRYLDKIPSKEDRQKRELANLLAKVIDKGNEYGVEVEFMNPLRETMRKLSENIITDQRAA
ncbi:hypothetical protein V6767_20275 [Martelella sp. FLE1502]